MTKLAKVFSHFAIAAKKEAFVFLNCSPGPGGTVCYSDQFVSVVFFLMRMSICS